MGPRIAIDLGCIERNARIIVDLCDRSGIKVFGVTKGTCGMPQVARAMLRGGVTGIAESRFENIRRLRESGISCPIMLLRSPPMARIEEVVRNVDISLQSELATIREISRVAERMGRIHNIIVMVDLGDLREGIWPNDLLPSVEKILELRGVRIAGIGTNLTCFGAIVPTEENLGQLVAHAYKVERLAGMRLDWVSGGNSSSLPLLRQGRMPAGINNLRIGEAILQGGVDAFRADPWPELETDAFRLTGELIEVKLKPSLPIGEAGFDAFGKKPLFVDEGDRLRAIANIGREDTIVEGLTPIEKGVRVLGASSDHLVLDVTDANPALAVGDSVGFRMNYGALLTAMTSEYVEKAPMQDAETIAPPKTVAIDAEPDATQLLTSYAIDARLQAMDYDVTFASDIETVPAASIRLCAGEDRRCALRAVTASAGDTDSLGLIWIDSIAALLLPGTKPDLRPDSSVLARLFGLDGSPGTAQPQLSPENVVLVGLRHADPSEASLLKNSRITAFTMAEIDASGMRDVMREALKIASSGTRGFHVCYSPPATEMHGWSKGAGGITVRETHQAMETIALNGGMISMNVSGLTQDLSEHVASETVNFVMSAFGKRIL